MKNESPTILAIFGATGDLVSRKLLPALYHLYHNRQLPKKFKVVGIARRPFSDVQFRKLMKQALTAKIRKPEKADEFLNLFSYHQGQFDEDSTYTSLKKVLSAQDAKWKTKSNKLFYLATPPNSYDHLLHKLHSTNLGRQTGSSWTRIIVEKPFGKDLDHAEHLDVLLGKLFSEDQVYRIDHYLAKEVLQNVMAFRFANNLLEDVWNRKFVEKIEIKLLEEIDVDRQVLQPQTYMPSAQRL
jgi:glucose-6-phosphate 1-dehydrogenase